MATEVFTSFIQITDSNLEIVSGAEVSVYAVNSTTPLSVFSNPGLSVSAANPIICDSSGRHDMRYIAAGSYKIVVRRTAAGATIITRDDIDGRIPIGSGALAIANGGTGSTSAGAALAALGGATAAELADVSADVAALAGTLASTEKTHIATGTTAQRAGSPVDGDIRRNTTLSTYEVYGGGVWSNLVIQPTSVTDPSAADTYEGLIELAVQSEMETGTDVVRAVTPGRQHYHQSAAKAWCDWGIDGTRNASYNVSSVTDNGTGDWTINFTTAFSGVNYARIATSQSNDTVFNAMIMTSAAKSASATRFVNIRDGGASVGGATDPSAMFSAFFGDQ